METPIDRHVLFNEVPDGETYPHNDKWHAHLLDQYKLYVEMADRISSRRATANSYFLSLNSASFVFVGYFTKDGGVEYLWALAAGGFALSLLWYALITSYRNLNTAKWLVVHQIEKRLPISPYDAEWEAMGRGKKSKLYLPISHVERGVPLVFAGLHLIVLLTSLPWLRH